MSLKTCRALVIALAALGSLILFVGARADLPVCMLAGAFAMMAGVVLALLYYNCPHCGSRLGQLSPRRDKFCPHCGGEIDWDKKQSWRK